MVPSRSARRCPSIGDLLVELAPRPCRPGTRNCWGVRLTARSAMPAASGLFAPSPRREPRFCPSSTARIASATCPIGADFRHETRGPIVDRALHRRGILGRRDHDHRYRRIFRPQHHQPQKARHPRHMQVEQDQVRAVALSQQGLQLLEAGRLPQLDGAEKPAPQPAAGADRISGWSSAIRISPAYPLRTIHLAREYRDRAGDWQAPQTAASRASPALPGGGDASKGAIGQSRSSSLRGRHLPVLAAPILNRRGGPAIPLLGQGGSSQGQKAGPRLAKMA